jgi:hypothetical protein
MDCPSFHFLLSFVAEFDTWASQCCMLVLVVASMVMADVGLVKLEYVVNIGTCLVMVVLVTLVVMIGSNCMR